MMGGNGRGIVGLLVKKGGVLVFFVYSFCMCIYVCIYILFHMHEAVALSICSFIHSLSFSLACYSLYCMN